ncbi:MAG: hypothetical protein AAF989_06715 [Planctomycetota bacterium]
MAKKPRIPNRFRPWIEARKKFRLSHAHIQMARELGLSPKRFGKYSDLSQQPGKLSLANFITSMYKKRFGKTAPDPVWTIEEIAAQQIAKREARKEMQAELAETPLPAVKEKLHETQISDANSADASLSEDHSPSRTRSMAPTPHGANTERDTS